MPSASDLSSTCVVDGKKNLGEWNTSAHEIASLRDYVAALETGLSALEARLHYVETTLPVEPSKDVALERLCQLELAQATAGCDQLALRWPKWSALNMEVTAQLRKWITTHYACSTAQEQLQRDEAKLATELAGVGLETVKAGMAAASTGVDDSTHQLAQVDAQLLEWNSAAIIEPHLDGVVDECDVARVLAYVHEMDKESAAQNKRNRLLIDRHRLQRSRQLSLRDATDDRAAESTDDDAALSALNAEIGGVDEELGVIHSAMASLEGEKSSSKEVWNTAVAFAQQCLIGVCEERRTLEQKRARLAAEHATRLAAEHA
ncbi:MAG: hypothetical protein EOO65_05945, partial [Methanosarcinales archaeon]